MRNIFLLKERKRKRKKNTKGKIKKKPIYISSILFWQSFSEFSKKWYVYSSITKNLFFKVWKIGYYHFCIYLYIYIYICIFFVQKKYSSFKIELYCLFFSEYFHSSCLSVFCFVFYINKKQNMFWWWCYGAFCFWCVNDIFYFSYLSFHSHLVRKYGALIFFFFLIFVVWCCYTIIFFGVRCVFPANGVWQVNWYVVVCHLQFWLM